MNSPAKTTQKSLHYYVINLPQSDERRRHMRDVLGSLFSPPRFAFSPPSQVRIYHPRNVPPYVPIKI